MPVQRQPTHRFGGAMHLPSTLAEVNALVADGNLLGSSASLVFVSGPEDFPAAVAGVITLGVGVSYLLTVSIDLGTDRLVTDGECRISGVGRHIVLETTNGTQLLTLGHRASVDNITLQNNTGPCVKTGQPSAAYNFASVDFYSATADIFNGSSNTTMEGCAWRGAAGMTYSGTNGALVAHLCRFLVTGNVIFLEVLAGATALTFDISNCQFITAAGQTGLKIDAAVAPTAQGHVTANTFSGAGVFVDPAGATPETASWSFKGNPGVEDSETAGIVSFEGNTLTTTIPAQGTTGTVDANCVDINTDAAWALDGLSERFALENSQELVYKGVEKSRLLIYLDARVEGAANNKTFEVSLQKNGVEVGFLVADYRSTPVNVSHTLLVCLLTDDILTLGIRNITDATNVAAGHAQISAIKGA
jgi:hypothetical protein